ncbi:hypothetical protein A0H81_00250 [Grifola frondosa]|uniref:Uncharacterized protein n=1 Tax=Grifola frondosa TaxID=5627 RepID=A0A1C7MP76_GRIFR|nr:hypothetical protein A0H81_00250 [Grifola frondosa]
MHRGEYEVIAWPLESIRLAQSNAYRRTAIYDFSVGGPPPPSTHLRGSCANPGSYAVSVMPHAAASSQTMAVGIVSSSVASTSWRQSTAETTEDLMRVVVRWDISCDVSAAPSFRRNIPAVLTMHEGFDNTAGVSEAPGPVPKQSSVFLVGVCFGVRLRHLRP